MHCVRSITRDLYWIGGNDRRLALFESAYPVPRGVSYNAYVLLDEKTVLFDTVDRSITDQFFENLDHVLDGRALDYVVVHHMEPDHAATLRDLLARRPDVTVVGNQKTLAMFAQFFGQAPVNTLVVKEGETLSLGRHTLTFCMAPMVHWPEVMVSYESCEKILFSADGFGTFGALSAGQSWEKEAARYYFNIVGKYGAQVQALLKKAAGLDIRTICPLHGPVLRENLGFYLDKYDRWSRYEPEEKDAVLVAFATIHGNTAQAAGKMKEILERRGCGRVALVDLCREDQAVAVEEAFRCGKLVAMSPTYDGGLFPAMDHFMAHLRDKTYRSRTVALIENGSWAPSAAKHMRAYLEAMKDVTICPTVHTIQGAVKEADVAAMERIADEVLA